MSKPQEVVIRLVVEGHGGSVSTRSDEVPFKTRKLDTGEVIYKQGDDASSVFLIESGMVKSYILGRLGEESAVRICRKKDIVGELALRSNVRHNTAVAMEHCVIREYETSELWDSISGNAASQLLIPALLEKIDQLTKEHGAPVPTLNKLVEVLISIAEKDGKPVPGGMLVDNRLTHEVLAGMIGSRRETVTLHMQKLRAMGAAEQRGKGMFISPTILRGVV